MLFTNWMKITGDAAMLGIETQQVMHLRMMKLFAGGPQAQSEALRMVTEKTTALAEATMTLARGGSAQRVIRRYRTHVKSNQRRLSKPWPLAIPASVRLIAPDQKPAYVRWNKHWPAIVQCSIKRHMTPYTQQTRIRRD